MGPRQSFLVLPSRGPALGETPSHPRRTWAWWAGTTLTAGLSQKQGSQATPQSRSLPPETLSKETQTSLQATEQRPCCPLGRSSPASDIPAGLGRRGRCWSVLGPGFQGLGMTFLEKGERRCQEPNGTTSTKLAGQSPMLAGR